MHDVPALARVFLYQGVKLIDPLFDLHLLGEVGLHEFLQRDAAVLVAIDFVE